jgi:hypothetical protein
MRLGPIMHPFVHCSTALSHVDMREDFLYYRNACGYRYRESHMHGGFKRYFALSGDVLN